MNQKVKKIIFLFISLIFSVPAYIILHEAGHSLVAILCGAKITKFSILEAYMNYDGGVFTETSLSLFHIAGMLLPVLLSIAYMMFYRSTSVNQFYRIFSFIALVMPIGAIGSWIFVPILYLFDMAPAGDDVSKFIVSSGIAPWIVVLGAITLLVVVLLYGVLDMLQGGCLFRLLCGNGKRPRPVPHNQILSVVRLVVKAISGGFYLLPAHGGHMESLR